MRVFQDGEYVFAHTEYDFFGPKIGFDIFRFENGKIVEHWDNLQETPKTPNPSGHSMIDGPTTSTDPDRTDANKKLVAAFVDDILVGGRLEKLQGYFNGDKYVQHNPQIADGLTGLSAALAELAKQGVTMKYDREKYWAPLMTVWRPGRREISIGGKQKMSQIGPPDGVPPAPCQETLSLPKKRAIVNWFPEFPPSCPT